MASEEDIAVLMNKINNSLSEINSKPTINMSTLLTSLAATIILGGFGFYIGMVKFTSDITHQVNDNSDDINILNSNTVKKSYFNTHIEQGNYNFEMINEKIDVKLIIYKPIK